MHELGVVIEVVKTVEDFARKNGLTKVDKIVLQIGEMSAMIPHYIEACFPAAVEGTMLRETSLEIEILPSNAICASCAKVFNFVQNRNGCPICGNSSWEVLGGREFLIKEIVAC